MTSYTVQRLAKLSGVSVRTLHYYDEIGLLKPAYVGGNGYRYYEREQLLRLQQILFFRELNFSLSDIAGALAKPDFDRVETLRAHRKRLEAEAERYQRLLRTLDRTIDALSPTARDEALFEGFSAEKQNGYENYLIERGGEEMAASIAGSKARIKNWTKEDHARARDEIIDIETKISAAMAQGLPADAPAVQALIARHHAWVSQYWTPNHETYAGLGRLYTEHLDFVARYERYQAGMADYLCAAIAAYAAKMNEGAS